LDARSRGPNQAASAKDGEKLGRTFQVMSIKRRLCRCL
jgi:hypothetical protein